MTQSGSPRGRETDLEQEEMWEDPSPGSDADALAASAEASPDRRGSGSRGFTHSITSTSRTPGPTGFYYADVPNRIMALVIDIIVLSIIGFFLALLFGGLVTRPGALDTAGGELDVAPFLLVTFLELAISFFYFAYLWVTLRGTVGMKLLGLQIGDEVDGHSIGWRQASIRWLIIGIPSVLASLASFVPSIVGVVLTIIGAAWLLVLLYSIAQSPTKQGLQDRYAGTILVKEGRRVA